MFQKRKKFKEEITPKKRLSDRWDQQVFFIKNKFPDCDKNITAIVSEHESRQGAAFIPCEEALTDLANLYTSLRNPS